MNDIHEKLNKIKNIENPIDLVANEISNNIQVLCLDEFIINDIADAMILGELLKGLFANNVIVIFTSNTEPKICTKTDYKEKILICNRFN